MLVQNSIFSRPIPTSILNPLNSSASSPSPKLCSRPRQPIALLSIDADPAGSDLWRYPHLLYLREVGEVLAKLGWQVDLFTRKTHPDQPEVVQHSAHCRTIRLSAGPEQVISQEEMIPYLPRFVQALQGYGSKQNLRYALLHSHSLLSAWVGLHLKKEAPSLQWVHTQHKSWQEPVALDHDPTFQSELLTHVNGIIADSTPISTLLRTDSLSQTQVEWIPADPHLHIPISKQQARSELNWGFQSMVLYVGRLALSPALDSLIKAIPMLRDSGQLDRSIHLVLVDKFGADPEQFHKLHRQIQTMGLSDHLRCIHGITKEHLSIFYRAADVCVVPEDLTGHTPVEATVWGTPVIVANSPGLRFTVVPEETGLILSTAEPESWAEAITQVLTDDLWSWRLTQPICKWANLGIQLSHLYRRLLLQFVTGESLWSAPEILPWRIRLPYTVEPEYLALAS